MTKKKIKKSKNTGKIIRVDKKTWIILKPNETENKAKERLVKYYKPLKT